MNDPDKPEKVHKEKVVTEETANDGGMGRRSYVDSDQLLRRLNNRQIQLIAIGKSSRFDEYIKLLKIMLQEGLLAPVCSFRSEVVSTQQDRLVCCWPSYSTVSSSLWSTTVWLRWSPNILWLEVSSA